MHSSYAFWGSQESLPPACCFFFFLFDIGSTASVSPSPAIAVSVISKKLSIKEGINESYAAKPIPSQTHLHIPSESRLSSGEGEGLEALLYRTNWHHVRDPRLALSTLAQFSGRQVSWATVWADAAAQLAGPWLESGSTYTGSSCTLLHFTVHRQPRKSPWQQCWSCCLGSMTAFPSAAVEFPGTSITTQWKICWQKCS